MSNTPHLQNSRLNRPHLAGLIHSCCRLLSPSQMLKDRSSLLSLHCPFQHYSFFCDWHTPQALPPYPWIPPPAGNPPLWKPPYVNIMTPQCPPPASELLIPWVLAYPTTFSPQCLQSVCKHRHTIVNCIWTLIWKPSFWNQFLMSQRTSSVSEDRRTHLFPLSVNRVRM